MVSLMALNKGLKGSVCGILLKNGGVSSFQDITNSLILLIRNLLPLQNKKQTSQKGSRKEGAMQR